MPIHPHLDGVHLDVAYRASTEPQTLDIGVQGAGPSEIPLAPWAVGTWIACINRGLGGGSEFSPSSGRASLEAGPTGAGDADLGPSYAFRLSVAAVSPRFLRVLVEHLAASCHPHPLTSISIVGGLPPDGSPLSVRERELGLWLDDADAYPAAWAEPGFRVSTRSIPRGATVRVTLGAGASLDVVGGELEEVFSAWQDAVLTYPDAKRQGRGVMDPHGAFARTRTELLAKVGLFDHARAPAQAALINGLARFHASIAPIAGVEIAMP